LWIITIKICLSVNIYTLTVNPDDEESCSTCSSENSTDQKRRVIKINEQPRDSKSSRNRYTLQFFQESKEKLQKRKERAFKCIEPVTLKDQEISNNYFPPGIDMPKRPSWNFNMTKEQLELREQRYFTVCNCDFML